jgi:D-sedoheptulose 7-phosphate isomerase
MIKDPRHLNEHFDSSSIGAYLADYAETLRSAMLAVDSNALNHARELIEGAATNGRKIYAIGNGGSAALYSAIANDYGFEKVFSTQVGYVGRPGDVLLAISSSGNSANILGAVATAHEVGMSTIGLSGFSGGLLKPAVNVSLHVDANNYGIVEDVHQSLMHVLAQFIACHRDAGTSASAQPAKGMAP